MAPRHRGAIVRESTRLQRQFRDCICATQDILSNSNNPVKIMPHIGAVFDGIDRLTFAEPSKLEQLEEESDEEPKKEKPPTEASSMVAKDGEDARSRRLEALRGLHFVGVTRLHQRRRWVFFCWILSLWKASGPSRRVRETAGAAMA